LGSFCRDSRLLSIHFHHRGVRPDWAWRIIYALARLKFKYIIYPSNFIRDEATEICPFLKAHENAVSYAFPTPIEIPEDIRHRERQSARGALGIPSNAVVIGNAGWMIPRKRWDIFLQVAAMVARKFPDAKFLMAGDGPEAPKLRALATSLGLNGRVIWLGWQKDLKQFYDSLDIMLFNSDWDAMGRTPLEAMSLGIPVVASVLHGGLSEIIDSENCGYLIDTHDIPRLAAKVMEIARDPSLGARLAAQGREKIEKIGSPEKHALKVLHLFRQRAAQSPVVATVPAISLAVSRR
jgi:glycosyltransferase involved in cell wall biosynthesis